MQLMRGGSGPGAGTLDESPDFTRAYIPSCLPHHQIDGRRVGSFLPDRPRFPSSHLLPVLSIYASAGSRIGDWTKGIDDSRRSRAVSVIVVNPRCNSHRNPRSSLRHRTLHTYIIVFGGGKRLSKPPRSHATRSFLSHSPSCLRLRVDVLHGSQANLGPTQNLGDHRTIFLESLRGAVWVHAPIIPVSRCAPGRRTSSELGLTSPVSVLTLGFTRRCECAVGCLTG
jgi:hypothetical protein